MEKTATKTFQDHMGCKDNKEIMAQLETAKGEYVIFSCPVIKNNRWGRWQERTLLVTNLSIFNIKKDQV
jgi:hypothetical protein